MYILQFFVNGFSSAAGGLSSAAESIFCIVFRFSETPPEETERETLMVDTEGNYASLEDVATNHSLGLTAAYQSWFESKQALVHAVGHLVTYLSVAVIGFSFVFEKWYIHDSLYFAIVVFTTVGYGDLSPTSNYSRIFVVCFALYGIIILGIFLGIVGAYIMQRHDENMQKRLANARTKVMEQFGETNNALPPEKRSLLNDVLVICLAEAPIILILVVLGAPIVYLEEWDVIMGAYWMVVTGTTIGFGDLGPTQMATRCICIVWIPLAVAVLGEFLGRVAGTYIDRRNDEMEDQFMDRTMTLADLRRMDTDKDDKVSPNEFLRYMLVALQKVEKEEIDEIMDLFKKLDRTEDGVISKEDLMTSYNLNVRPGLIVDLEHLRASC